MTLKKVLCLQNISYLPTNICFNVSMKEFITEKVNLERTKIENRGKSREVRGVEQDVLVEKESFETGKFKKWGRSPPDQKDYVTKTVQEDVDSSPPVTIYIQRNGPSVPGYITLHDRVI